jgi:hypothetical protein
MCVAAGSTASVAVAASVVSLTEGVLKTMLLTKLKGTALSLGTLGVIVSGAVVLGQSNSGPGRPIYPTQEFRKDAAPTPSQKKAPTSDDRTDAVERKLDRILKALDRLAGDPALPVSNFVVNPVVNPFGQLAPVPSTAANPVRDHATTETFPSPEPVIVGHATEPAETDRLTTVRPSMIAVRQGLSISQRLQSVEEALASTNERLAKLEARLAGLEKHVGVNFKETLPTLPTPQPSATR